VRELLLERREGGQLRERAGMRRQASLLAPGAVQHPMVIGGQVTGGAAHLVPEPQEMIHLRAQREKAGPGAGHHIRELLRGRNPGGARAGLLLLDGGQLASECSKLVLEVG
jgi:hypothetical protein